MASINSRQDLIDYCLRKLGEPVIEVSQNMSEDQLSDRLDDALQYFREWHMLGSEKVYVKHALTSDDITNQYLILSDQILSVNRVFNPQGTTGFGWGADSFSGMQWQMALSDMQFFTGPSVEYYAMMRSGLSLIEQVLVGEKPLAFNQHSHKLDIIMDWGIVGVGQILVAEAYAIVSPDDFTNVFNDMWLKRYTTCLIKKQWGLNLKKFQNIKLPGGVILQGQQIYDEAVLEQSALEQEMEMRYTAKPLFFIG